MSKFNIVFLFAGHVVIWSLVVVTIFYLIDLMMQKWRKFKYVTLGVKKMSLQELRWLRRECDKQIAYREKVEKDTFYSGDILR